MAANTVVVKGNGIRKERLAGAAITPGHVLKLQSGNTVVPHNGAAETTSTWVAIENEIFGKDLNTAYATNDNVLIEVLVPGCEFYALIGAGAPAIVIGDILEIGTVAGTLRKVVASGSTPHTSRMSARFRALQAVNNSGGSSSVRCLVEVI
jgi:hypothetical protein